MRTATPPQPWSPRSPARWPLAGLALALLLHVVAGWGMAPGHAQGTNTTNTTSTTSATGFESPPACSVIGSTREVETVTVQFAIGPACIGIGNRDIPNPSPACGSFPPGDPDPAFGETRTVLAGQQNFNTNTHTLTLACVAPTPALPWPWLIGLGAGVLGAGAGMVRRRRNVLPEAGEPLP